MLAQFTGGDIAGIAGALVSVIGVPWAIIKYIRTQLDKKADKEDVTEIKKALEMKAEKEHVRDMFDAHEGKDALIVTMLKDINNKIDLLFEKNMK